MIIKGVYIDHKVQRRQQYYSQRPQPMSRPRNLFQEQQQQDMHLNNPNSARSPLRRAPYNHQGQQAQPKSPIRSRTPVRPLSPISHHHTLPTHIRYIANVSPLRNRHPHLDNQPDLSNGKNIRYINGSKTERNVQTARKNEPSRPPDRQYLYPEDNRLFSKIVDKLNSEKKGPPPNQNSNKTSFLTDTEPRPRVQPCLRPSGTFKQLVSLAKAGQTRSEVKPRSRGEDPPSEEEENFSCLAYRMKSPRDEPIGSQLVATNQCSPVVRRKPSKPENTIRESGEDFRCLDLLLEKIEGASTRIGECGKEEEAVRGSLNVRESLSMDPFL